MSRPSRAEASCSVLEADSLAPHTPRALLAPLRGPGARSRLQGGGWPATSEGEPRGARPGPTVPGPCGLGLTHANPRGPLGPDGKTVPGRRRHPSPLSWVLSFTSPPSLFFITQHGRLVKRQPPSSVPGKVLWAGWGGPLPRPPDLPPERTW